MRNRSGMSHFVAKLFFHQRLPRQGVLGLVNTARGLNPTFDPVRSW